MHCVECGPYNDMSPSSRLYAVLVCTVDRIRLSGLGRGQVKSTIAGIFLREKWLKLSPRFVSFAVSMSCPVVSLA